MKITTANNSTAHALRSPLAVCLCLTLAPLGACSSTGSTGTAQLDNGTNDPQINVASASAKQDNLSLESHSNPEAVAAKAPPQLSAAREEFVAETIDVTRVTFADEGADFDPCVSSDGSRLVYASTQHRATSDIYLKRTDSRVVTQLTNDPADDAMPAISPDGTKVAFASNRAGNWDIYIMPITGAGGGGKAVQVTSDDADEMQPSWSPDGKHLVYSRGNADGRWEMWVSKAGNNAAAQFIGYGMSPRWCPVAGTGEEGADKILFQQARERGRRSFSLWTLDYISGKTSNVTEVDGGSALALLNPAWSHDGRWITFAQADLSDPANSNVTKPGRTSIWMVSVHGEGKVRLTSDRGLALSPVWAGDDTLYYISDRAGIDNVWSLKLTSAVTAASAALDPSPSIRRASRPSEDTTPALQDTIADAQPAQDE